MRSGLDGQLAVAARRATAARGAQSSRGSRPRPASGGRSTIAYGMTSLPSLEGTSTDAPNQGAWEGMCFSKKDLPSTPSGKRFMVKRPFPNVRQHHRATRT